MNITDLLKEQLLGYFSNEKVIARAVENFEVYKFAKLNQIQLQKLFDVKSENIFSDLNARKHLNKVMDMIKQNFFNDKTGSYLSVLLFPSKDEVLYKERKKVISLVSDMVFEDDRELRRILSEIEDLNLKVVFAKTVYTFEKSIANTLYEDYKINSFVIAKKEFEEVLFSGNADFVVVTDEDLFVDIECYKLREFKKLIEGLIIKNNTGQILRFLDFLEKIKDYDELLGQIMKDWFGKEFCFNFDRLELKRVLEANLSESFKELTNKVLCFDTEIDLINLELKSIISQKKLLLDGEELLDLLNSGNVSQLQSKFNNDLKEIIVEKERRLLKDFIRHGIGVDYLFEERNYPLRLTEEVKHDLFAKIDKRLQELEFELFEKLGKFDYNVIRSLWDYAYLFDFLYGLSKFVRKHDLKYPVVSDELRIILGRNIYIQGAVPVDYGLGVAGIGDVKLQKERISVLTGANSGGKTTLLEMFLQVQILSSLGLGIAAAEESLVLFVDEVIYLKKFTGTQGSGAFEQTIRNLIEILDKDSSKLILIDEFEAITEPGAAAKILIGFLSELAKGENYCVAVSHLGGEIKEYLDEKKIKDIRIDGISAVGLDEGGNLITNHQPQFYELGKSTPELILKRILNDKKFWEMKSDKTKDVLERISK